MHTGASTSKFTQARKHTALSRAAIEQPSFRRLGSDCVGLVLGPAGAHRTDDGLIRPNLRDIYEMIFQSGDASAAFEHVRTAPCASPIAILKTAIGPRLVRRHCPTLGSHRTQPD
jgi:hypothetical protein